MRLVAAAPGGGTGRRPGVCLHPLAMPWPRYEPSGLGQRGRLGRTATRVRHQPALRHGRECEEGGTAECEAKEPEPPPLLRLLPPFPLLPFATPTARPPPANARAAAPPRVTSSPPRRASPPLRPRSACAVRAPPVGGRHRRQQQDWRQRSNASPRLMTS